MTERNTNDEKRARRTMMVRPSGAQARGDHYLRGAGERGSCCLLGAFGPRDSRRPLGTFRPIGGEPSHRGVKPPHGDVAAFTQQPKFLAVVEYAMADRLLFDGPNPRIFVRQKDQVMNLKHGDVIGLKTGDVNGCFTDGKNFSERSEYRPC
ncbi:hypothetical protein [Rhizobium leguminosarum]|uniref:hypothetical protein n=1 Tax=Rhizobium leguminosarum TaxID=384 RepID=UPI0013BC7789|nr:hypothetical protein [Rhizobium leguminosarum]NEI60943.1 hypothetical protein [Rhizobium leguminosarum]